SLPIDIHAPSRGDRLALLVCTPFSLHSCFSSLAALPTVFHAHAALIFRFPSDAVRTSVRVLKSSTIDQDGWVAPSTNSLYCLLFLLHPFQRPFHPSHWPSLSLSVLGTIHSSISFCPIGSSHHTALPDRVSFFYVSFFSMSRSQN